MMDKLKWQRLLNKFGTTEQRYKERHRKQIEIVNQMKKLSPKGREFRQMMANTEFEEMTPETRTRRKISGGR